MPIIISKSRLTGLIAIATGCLAGLSAQAEYHGFNTASGADGIVQEVRWPVWAESTYNASFTLANSLVFNGGTLRDEEGTYTVSGAITVKTGGGVFAFNDLDSTTYLQRFYQILML
jgi:hypothetical protein